MRVFVYVFAVASIAVGCGGIAHRDRDVAVEAGVTTDAGGEAGDHVVHAICAKPTPVPSTSSSGASCRFDADCAGGATCQAGVCCSGEVKDGACTCGGAPGCDLQHVCCVARGATTPSCVNGWSACGAW